MLAELCVYRNAQRIYDLARQILVKFHLSVAEGNVFTGYGTDYVRLGVVEYRESLLVTPDKIATGWASGGFDALTAEDFSTVAAMEPEVVILGTGATLRFPQPRLTRALTDAGIGVEVMDTAAACRTFNILAAEGRKVAAAILIDRA